MMKPERIKVLKVVVDGGTQSRADLNDDVVEQLAEAIGNGAILPPIDVFHTGGRHVVVDGFHRLAAHKSANVEMIDAIVHQGDLEEAQWFSFAANKQHDIVGLKRSNADKRRAVQAALRHPKSETMSNVALAEYIGVSEFSIRRYRNDFDNIEVKPRTGRDGRTINTANIGKSARDPDEPTGKCPPMSEMTGGMRTLASEIGADGPEPTANVPGDAPENEPAPARRPMQPPTRTRLSAPCVAPPPAFDGTLDKNWTQVLMMLEDLIIDERDSGWPTNQPEVVRFKLMEVVEQLPVVASADGEPNA
jgi:ParB-like nuclease domain